MGTQTEENIYRAVETIAENIVSQLKYDRTVKAEIMKLENADIGEYKIKYGGAENVTAFAQDITQTYKEGEAVFVKILDQDLSEQKFITGRVTRDSLSAAQQTQLQNSIIERSPSLDELYLEKDNFPSASVRAGATEGQPYYSYSIYETNGQSDLQFQQYANKYSHIQISAQFRTELLNTHKSGKYGLEVVFKTNSGSLQTYVLDISSFNASPYKLTQWSLQSAVFDVPSGILQGLQSVTLFQSDFIPDSDQTDVVNIFVKDVKIKFVDIVDMSTVSYYPLITATYGSTFPITRNNGEMELRAHLYNQGADLASNSQTSFLWFVRDLTIVPGSVYYDRNAGAGWAALPEGSNGIAEVVKVNEIKNDDKVVSYTYDIKPKGETEIIGQISESVQQIYKVGDIVFFTRSDQATVIESKVSYKTDNYILLSQSDVNYNRQYKVVITHNNVVTTAEIEVYNRTSTASNYNFSLSKELTSEGRILLKLTEGYTGDLYFSTLDGSYGKIGSFTADRDSIDVTFYLTTSSVTFYCNVSKDGTDLGVLTYVLKNSESADDITVTFDGQSTFLYDANGDITYEDSEKTRSLRVNLEVGENVSLINPTLKWKIGNEEIPEYTGKGSLQLTNSMIKEIWFDKSNNILYYKVQQRYRQGYNNNSLTLEISTLDKDEPYIFRKDIIFLKDGDQGTNGTSLFCVIRPCKSATDLTFLSGYHPFISSALPLACKVYKDGNEIAADSYTWTSIGVRISSSQSRHTSVTGLPSNYSINDPHYVRVEVSVGDWTIYAFYPIDIQIGNFEDTVWVDDIPQYVKYSSSGVTPITYKNNLYFSYGGNKDKPNSGTQGKIQNLSQDLFTNAINKDISGEPLKPVSQLTSAEYHVGILKLVDTANKNNYIIRSVIMYLDTYGNEAINGWDGMSVDLGDDDHHYIFAPQVGAGYKDNNNKFYGVVMGEDSSQGTVRNKRTGLFGYDKGETSFGLKIDGTAFFGKASGGGRIEVSGEEATIYGGVKGADNSMTLTLANKEKNPKTQAIKVGNNVFTVTYDGSMYAEVGKIGGKNGDGNGWTIEANKLTSGNVTLYSGSAKTYAPTDTPEDYYRIWAGSSKTSPRTAKFSVTNSGVMKASEADITGAIKAKRGYIGYTSNSSKGWEITNNTLFGARTVGTTTNYVALSKSGNYAFYAGATEANDNGQENTNNPAYMAPFSVKFDGSLKATKADIEGKITATSGTIGNWKINSNTDGALRSSVNGTRIYLDGAASGNNKALYISYHDTAPRVDELGYELDNEGHYLLASNSKPIYSFRYQNSNNVWIELEEPYDSNGEKLATQYSLVSSPTSWKTFPNLSLLKKSDYQASSNGYFYVTANGQMYAYGADIRGTISAKDGSIGGWTISRTGIYSSNGKVGMSRSGDYRFWVGENDNITKNEDGTITINSHNQDDKPYFYVTNSGQLECRGATINGGKLSITKGNNTIELSATNGLLIKKGNENTFHLDGNGNIIMKGEINATGGSIGGWKIGSSKLYYKAEDDTTEQTATIYLSGYKSNSLKSDAVANFDDVSIDQYGFIKIKSKSQTLETGINYAGCIGYGVGDSGDQTPGLVITGNITSPSVDRFNGRFNAGASISSGLASLKTPFIMLSTRGVRLQTYTHNLYVTQPKNGLGGVYASDGNTNSPLVHKWGTAAPTGQGLTGQIYFQYSL